MRRVSVRQGYSTSVAIQRAGQHEDNPPGNCSRLGDRDRSNDIGDTGIDRANERLPHKKTVHSHHGVRRPFQRPLIRLSPKVNDSTRDGRSKERL